MLAGTVVAWIAILLSSLSLSRGIGSGSHHGAELGGATGLGTVPIDALSLEWAGTWLLMTAAMMWPLLVPVVDRVSRAVRPRWRPALTSVVVVVATALWFAVGFAAALVAQIAHVPSGSVWWQLAFIAAAAVAWRSARRNRLLARCAKLPPVAPAGVRGIRGAARVGFVSWTRCALLCGPLMLAMVVGHSAIVMIAASASVWWEAWHPRARRDRVPLALIIVAGLGAIAGGVLSS